MTRPNQVVQSTLLTKMLNFIYTAFFLSNITKELVVRKQWCMQFHPFTKKNKFTVLLNKDQMLLYTVC